MDEKNELVSEKDELKHYGVLGMRWGFRNSETLARYGRANALTKNAKEIAKKAFNVGADAAGKTLDVIGGKASKAAKNASKKIEKTRKERKIEKQQAKSLDMSRKEFRKVAEEEAVLRRAALDSHDAATVAKGMHLLSDKELKDKYSRLVTEKNIRGLMPPAKKNAKEIVKDILVESAKKNIAKPLADKATSEVYNRIAKSAGVDPETAQKAGEAIQKAIKQEVGDIPLSAVAESFGRGNWSAEGKNRYGGDFYEKAPTSQQAEPAANTTYSRMADSNYRNKYSQRNWTYHSGIED